MRIRRTLTGVLLATLASMFLSIMSGGSAAHADTRIDIGWLHIKNQGSGKCFDVRDQSSDPGALLQQVDCKNILGQQFELTEYPDGTYSLEALNSLLCAEVTYGGMGDWVPVQMNHCSGTAKQRFHVVPVTVGPVVYYAIEPAHVSGFCLRVDPRGPDTNTAEILQFRCDGNSAEHWSFY
jgi:hypothetical protein